MYTQKKYKMDFDGITNNEFAEVLLDSGKSRVGPFKQVKRNRAFFFPLQIYSLMSTHTAIYFSCNFSVFQNFLILLGYSKPKFAVLVQ